MRIAIRADGSAAVGLGHLGRCMALAQALKRRSRSAPVFISVDPACNRWVRARGFSVVPRLSGKWDLLIGDSYRFSPSDVDDMRRRARRLVLLDDCGAISGGCDWILNGSPAADRVAYRASEAALLLGPEFQPMRREFWRQIPRRKTRQIVRDVLVYLGGGTGWASMRPVVESVLEALPRATVRVIIGPLAADVPTRPPSSRVVIHRAPASLTSILTRCDLAVVTAGQVLLEAAWAGLPAVVMIAAENQRLNAEAMERRGVARLVGFLDARSLPGLRRTLKALARSPRMRVTLARRGQELVDGRGALRVASVLLGPVGNGLA